MRKIDPVRHEQKRRKILQAAWRCFLRNGLGASTAEICAEAVISPGHLYHYFESKDAIVAALATAKLDEATERIKRSITAGVPALDTILSEVGQLTDSRRRAEFALLFEMLAESTRTPAMARLLQDSSRQVRKLLATVLQHGQACGEIDPTVEPELAASVLIGVVDALRAMRLRAPDLDASKVAALFETAVRRLLGARA